MKVHLLTPVALHSFILVGSAAICDIASSVITCFLHHSYSDRSRSPTLRRSGSALSLADLPGFPRWRGPMGSAVRASQAMSNPQTCRPWPDYFGTFSDKPASDACSSSASCHHDSISSFSTNSAYFSSTHLSSVIATSAVTLQSNSAMSTNSTSQHQPLPQSNGISSGLSSGLPQHTPVVN